MEYDKAALVDAWIRRYSSPRSAEVQAETEWAYDELDDICDRNPSLCLELIARICANSNDDWVKSNLGSGPLEDLLARHGDSVIDDVEARAKADIKFRELLSAVWRNVISEEVWARIQRVVESKESRGQIP